MPALCLPPTFGPDVSSQLLLQHHACLSATMLPAMLVMGSPSETKTSINSCFFLVAFILVLCHSYRKVSKTDTKGFLSIMSYLFKELVCSTSCEGRKCLCHVWSCTFRTYTLTSSLGLLRFILLLLVTVHLLLGFPQGL